MEFCEIVLEKCWVQRFVENRGKINNFEFVNLFVSFNGKF